MKVSKEDSRCLFDALWDMVKRFQRETGTVARFVTDLEEIDPREPSAESVLRIVREQLLSCGKSVDSRRKSY